MLFSSVPFLFYFLPAVLICYTLAPKKFKNAVLVLFSLVFYAWGEPIYLILMLTSIGLGYLFGILMENDAKRKRLYLTLSVFSAVLMLGIFKYADFFISGFNAATGLSLPFLRLALPVGISFYTFQILSYTIDVYRGDAPAQRNVVSLAAYISLFPQLIAGPIVRYTDINEQLEGRTHSFEKTSYGIRRFVIGISKKIIIANPLGEVCLIFLESKDLSVLYVWLYAICFTLQIYYDFSGYSDMAIGLGKILGFDFLENFNYPYISRSVTEFWRRWHMSLGTWFRDYVYIPLGGNRVKPVRHLINILAVWALTGLWHGAQMNFVLWGLYFAALLMLEKYLLMPLLKKWRILSHLYTLLVVVLGFVLFNADSLSQAAVQISAMFGFGGLPLVSAESLYYLQSSAVVLAVGAIGATQLPKKLFEKLQDSPLKAVADFAEPVLLAAIFVLCVAYLADGSFNPFLYFRF